MATKKTTLSRKRIMAVSMLAGIFWPPRMMLKTMRHSLEFLLRGILVLSLLAAFIASGKGKHTGTLKKVLLVAAGMAPAKSLVPKPVTQSVQAKLSEKDLNDIAARVAAKVKSASVPRQAAPAPTPQKHRGTPRPRQHASTAVPVQPYSHYDYED